MLAEILAVLALLVSAGLLVLNYINLKERRHGEIVQLRSQVLTKLRSLRQHVDTIKVNFAILRLEIRRAPDSDFKYERIESLPPVLESAARTEKILAGVHGALEALDAKKHNRGEALFMLREQDKLCDKGLAIAEDIQSRCLSELESLRKILESSDVGVEGSVPESRNTVEGRRR